ncbi:hypothetical protein FIBSPDRAFT_1040612 [Athelia psychrophila]|uniref:Uncharacterized protein n=1 Tax=Athelia psychrophila TaxID=1759441 RepID=A0A166PY13_9AGAM|nr:hypothetical protein FIBSPDRAFT_1040612 [Fibularhizoctonia sp. CBS 109695]
MGSRIPKARPLAANKTSDSTLMNLEDAHKSLIALGGPALSLSELGRLYQGSFREALSRVLSGLKGRQGSAIARRQIQAALEGVSLRENAGNNIMESLICSEITATSRLESAQQALYASRKQLNEKVASLAVSERDINELQITIDRKKRTNILLRLLQEREKIRLSRFQEMAKLSTDHKTRIAGTENNTKPPILPDFKPSNHACPSVRETVGTLANLHAHHVHLKHLATQSHIDGSGEIELRLRHLAVHEADDGQFDEALSARGEALVTFARKSAERGALFSRHANILDHDLQALSDVVDLKKRQLQELSDRSIALGYTSKQHIDNIFEFRGSTSHTLKASIEGGAPQLIGYMEVLKWLIDNSASPECSAGDADLQEAFGLRAGTQEPRIVSEIERHLEIAHQKESFLENLIAPVDEDHEDEGSTLTRKYEADEQKRHDKAYSLLSRKAAKIDNTLVSDIETIVKEADSIASLGF